MGTRILLAALLAGTTFVGCEVSTERSAPQYPKIYANTAAPSNHYEAGEGDDSKIEELMNLARTRNNDTAQESATKALARIGTSRSRDALYDLVRENAGGGAYQAALRLKDIDPGGASDAILQIGRSGQKLGRDYKNILVKIGSESALEHFIREQDVDSIADFVYKNNDRSDFIQNRVGEIIPIFENAIKSSCGYHSLSDLRSYGAVIRKLDSNRAEQWAALSDQDICRSPPHDNIEGLKRQAIIDGLLGR